MKIIWNHRWLSLAESDSDFVMLFIRSWIPFNAWYCNNYPQYNKKDRLILADVKKDQNLFRTRILALLNGNDIEAQNFRSYLGLIHKSLEKYYVPNTQCRLTFMNLNFRYNPLKISSNLIPHKSLNYKTEYLPPPSQDRVKVMIVHSVNNLTKFSYNHTKYDQNHLKNYTLFQALTNEQQQYLIKHFEAINPNKTENIITESKRNKLDCGGVAFINNKDLISMAIIELLYQLRCILFHGEIQPSKDNLKVYEPAYYLLRLLLPSLK